MQILSGMEALQSAWNKDVKPQLVRLDDAPLPYMDSWNPVGFIQEYFYLYDTEDIMSLHPSQLYALQEALSKDANGKFKYHTVLWSWPKKSAKSSIVAAVVDYCCLFKPKSSWKLIGNDLKQADSRVGHYLRENIKIGQRKGYGDSLELQSFRMATKIKPSGYSIEYPNASRIEMIPIDPQGEAGGNDDGLVFSELWGWRHKSHEAMWTEQTISPTRYGYAQRWIDTYAGFEGESVVLENLYKAVVSDDNKLDIPHNPECYAANGIFACWVTQHHLPWQTKEYLESERAILHPAQYARIHENAWGQSAESFIDIRYWDECADSDIPALNRHDEIIIALDAGISSDCFAIVAVSRDKRFPAKYNAQGEQISPDHFVRRYARAWYPPKDGKIKFDGEDSPKSELKRLVEKWNVYQICYDPYQLEHFANELKDEMDTWVEEFSQAGEREKADKHLYDLIKDRRIVHYGNDTELRTHLLNAGAKIIGEDSKLRIIKKHPSKKIDLCVSLSMACYRASQVIPK